MPLYEYQCDACGHRFEVIQKSFSAAPPEACALCGGTVRKLPSSPAIQFKGSGWYITDYARAGKSEGGKPEAGKSEGGKSESAAETSDSKSESKGESKSDAKSDSKSGSKSDSKSETKTESKPSGSGKAPASSS